MLTQGLHTITLGGMMPGSKIMNPEFAGLMGGLLGNFTTDISIHAQLGRGFDITLSRTGALGNGGNLTLMTTIQKQWLMLQAVVQVPRQGCGSECRLQPALP